MELQITDTTKPVRTGEELDIDKLQEYIDKEPVPISKIITIEQFPGGHSNLTYLLKGEDEEYVLRRPPFGRKIKTAHDMSREFHILSKLKAVYDNIPKVYLYCDDEQVIGSPFYIMERKNGVILRKGWEKKNMLSPELMKKLSETLLDNLVNLHSVDYTMAGLGDLGKPEGYVERQVKGWTERYMNAKTDEIKEVESIAAWLASHMPAESGAALIHNDYKYDNLVLNANDLTKIEAVLDWEMATIGDPLMDFGTTLGYWMDPDDPAEMLMLRQQFGYLSSLPGNLNRQQLVERYAKKSERNISDMLFYYVFALFKISVIAQQIYHRYKQGFSKDERFAAMIFGVRILGNMAALAVDKGRINRLSKS